MCKRKIVVLSIMIVLFGVGLEARADEIRLWPNPVDRGGVMVIEAGRLPPGAKISAMFNKKPAYFFETSAGTIGLVGVDVMLKPGSYALSVKVLSGKGKNRTKKFAVKVNDIDAGTRYLKVNKSQVNLSKKDLERAKKERKLVRKALSVRTSDRLWQGGFLRPVQGEVISAFGRKTVINGQPRKTPHSGVDLDATTGTPVVAPAAGKVILTGEHFFAGGSVYIDHGQGLISMYFHLSRIDVKEGQEVSPGEQIGRVGATGRVTGPHLHYGTYLNGARISPLNFHAITRQIGQLGK